MVKSKRAILVEGPIGRILFKLTVPMIFGVLGMVAFNLVDTFFVGKLGTMELAALSFTFPVIFAIASLALGIGIGASAVISRAAGEGDEQKVKSLTTDSLILSLLFVAIIIVVGLLTLEPVFRLLGATDELIPLIKQYMIIWYPGMIFVVIPMVGNNAIRAIGDTKTPSAIMLIAVTVNGIMDPLLIFGLGPFPRLELAGAAIATVIARASTLIVSLYVLIFREQMITFARRNLADIIESWKRILYIGVPAAGTRIIVPVVMGVITRLLASYGPESVAAFGVAARLEFFALAVVWALASVIGPFVGQNWGAGKFDRVRLGIRMSERFAVLWGLGMCLLLVILAEPAASIFSSNPAVTSTIVLYLRIVPLAFGAGGVIILNASALNVLNRPLHATFLIFLQMVVFYIPLAHLGSRVFGLQGIFGGAAVAYIVAGVSAHFLMKYILNSMRSSFATQSDAQHE
ncbi:MATE family efflux transporter [Acidobacteriota bacterium]